MRLALVGFPSDTGVGMEIRDAVQYLPAVNTFYMNHLGKPMSAEMKTRTVGDGNLTKKMEAFIDTNKIDTVLTWEIPGHWDFPGLWERKGVRWFSVVHWDWFTPKRIDKWKKAKIIVPFQAASFGLKLVYGLDSTVLPVPVDLERLPFCRRDKADRFVTVYALGGPGDRRSIGAIVEAWRLLGEGAPPLTIMAQKKPLELVGIDLPKSVTLKIGVAGSVQELYADADVAVLPSKYEGVGLSLIEAQALGIPVITTGMEPMRSLAPDYLVYGNPGEVEILEGHKVATICATALGLAERVKEIAHSDIGNASEKARERIELGYSWKVLKDEWVKVLEAV